MLVKIDIEYPFADKNMRGVRIIDSPGVNAAGKVGDVTATYIESADAIMFLRANNWCCNRSKQFQGIFGI